ncbi:MAG TPA: glycine--tRNA ligase subunit beta, partial [Kofleriaceae bacterium]
VAATFDPGFLEVPEEMLITSMRQHQRYFAFNDANGKLANAFATLAATHVKDPKLVAEGNQKVLASRLSDARFFFGEDVKHTFEEWNATLESVVFQAKLPKGANTIGNKVARIAGIAKDATSGSPSEQTTVTAARYCKADLASKAVGEFPELQGTMGKHYANHHGLGQPVADAIEQHWWPKGQGAELPRTQEAAIVALADKMDTIVACFAVGLEPSGSADPFGLRRAAIGIWQILLAYPQLEWAKLFASARAQLEAQGVTLKDPTKLEDFFKQRLQGILVESGIPTQDANAALERAFQNPVDARARAQACAKISREAREVFKRIANILDDARAKKIEIKAQVNPAKFTSEVERTLHTEQANAAAREEAARAQHNYQAVFESLEQLRPAVAAFFDKGGVMVMDPDPELRDNRLALLETLIKPYAEIADFRKLGAAQ